MEKIQKDYDKVKLILQDIDSSNSFDDFETNINNLNIYRNKYKNLNFNSDASTIIPYPSIDDSNFYDVIAHKKEFNHNSPVPKQITSSSDYYNECIKSCNSNVFELTNNQLFISNFMSSNTPYNSLLLFHEVGVGKTCTAITLAEQFIDMKDRKIYVLMPSTLLKDNFKKQVYDSSRPDDLQCTSSKYKNMIPNHHRFSIETIEKKVNKLISSNYIFMGLLEFANDINRMAKELGVSNEDMETDMNFHKMLNHEYSNSVFIIDEVHNIRLNTDLTKKRVPPILQLVFKHVYNIKLLLMTATPMFNDPKEIIYIINLLLYNDKKPPLKLRDYFRKDGTIKSVDDLTHAFKGYISYMKGNNPFTFPIRLYPSVNDDKRLLKRSEIPTYDIKKNRYEDVLDVHTLEITKSVFTDKQEVIYKLAEDGLTNLEMSEKNMSVNSCIQLSNIAYPISLKNTDVCTGETGFWNCFSKTKGSVFGVKYKSEYLNILHYDNIGNYSCKMKTVIDYIRNSKGIVFVYSNWKWSGVLPLAIALEHEGYSKYDGKDILQNGVKNSNNLGNYVILSGDQQLSPNNDGEIRVLKSPSNKYGGNIKIVLATSVATEGIDLKCVRELHILEPWFHMNKIEQIIGRAVRTCSHMLLKPEEQNVTIYKHGSFVLNSKKEEIDFRLYRNSYIKQLKISDVENIMRNVSIDCNFNNYAIPEIDINIPLTTSQGNNIAYKLKTDTNQKCYSSVKLPLTVLDETTFDTKFYNSKLSKYERIIKSYFSKNQSGSYTDIRQYIEADNPKYNAEVLNLALNNLIIKKETFYNSFDELGYIIYVSDKYIFNLIMFSNHISLTQRKHRKSSSQYYQQIVNDHSQQKKQTSFFDTFKENIQSFCDFINIDSDTYKTITGHVIDYVVDRLDKNTYLNICSIMFDTEISDEYFTLFVDSLDRFNMIIRVNGKIRFVVVPFDGENVLYTRDKSGNMREITDLEKKENKTVINSNKLVYSDKLLTDYVGYITNTSEGHVRFKIIQKDKKSLGYVCDQTASLKISMLKDMINTLNPTYLLRFKKNPDKKKLCVLYELMIRINNDFARPCIANLIIQNLKSKNKK